jgi:hypothetical protein
MAEVNQDLLQQLHQNLASFEAGGFEEDAKAIRAKIAEVEGAKPKKASAKKTSKKARKTTAKKGK